MPEMGPFSVESICAKEPLKPVPATVPLKVKFISGMPLLAGAEIERLCPLMLEVAKFALAINLEDATPVWVGER